MIKNLLVPLTAGGANEAAVRTALAIAGNHRAQLLAMMTPECGMSLDAYFECRNLRQSSASAGCATAEIDHSVHARSRPGAATRSRWWEGDYDLTVIGGPSRGSMFDAPRSALLDLLSHCRRPALLVPANVAPSRFRNATLHWKDARSSGRLIDGALLLLAPGSTVDLVTCVVSPSSHWREEESFARAAERLAKSRIHVRPHVVPTRCAESSDEDFVAFALDRGAELDVMSTRSQLESWRGRTSGAGKFLTDSVRPTLLVN